MIRHFRLIYFLFLFFFQFSRLNLEMRKRQKGGGAIATSNGFTRCSIIVIECSRPIREMINCNVLNKNTLSFFFCETYLDSVTVRMVSGQGVWRNLRLELKVKHTDGFFCTFFKQSVYERKACE